MTGFITDTLHPSVCLIFFLSTAILTATVLHPAAAAVSLIFSFGLAYYMGGRRVLGFFFKILLPTILLTALLNPAFNHRGATILAYFPGGNPLTLESLAYGASSGVALGASILWFYCLGKALPAHRLVLVFGKKAPALTLLLSMTLRFVSGFVEGFRRVALAQRGLLGAVENSFLQRLRLEVRVVSAMVTWTLEGLVGTVDSMKSRGYGTGRPTSFSPTPFTARDGLFLAVTLALVTVFLLGAVTGGLETEFYPRLAFGGPFSPLILGAFGLLCAIPLILEAREAVRWKRLKLKL